MAANFGTPAASRSSTVEQVLGRLRRPILLLSEAYERVDDLPREIVSKFAKVRVRVRHPDTALGQRLAGEVLLVAGQDRARLAGHRGSHVFVVVFVGPGHLADQLLVLPLE